MTNGGKNVIMHLGVETLICEWCYDKSKEDSWQSRQAKSLPEASILWARRVCHRKDVMEIKKSKNIM